MISKIFHVAAVVHAFVGGVSAGAMIFLPDVRSWALAGGVLAMAWGAMICEAVSHALARMDDIREELRRITGA